MDLHNIVTIEFIPDPELGGFTAHMPHVPVYGEGKTEEGALADLKEGLRGYVDLYGWNDLTSRLAAPARLRSMNLQELVHG